MPEQLRVLWLWQPQSHTATIVQELALKNDKFTPVAPSPFREKAKKPVNRGPPVPRISSHRRGGPGGGRDGAHGPSAPVYQVAAAAEEQQEPLGGARIKREAISISSNDSHQPMDTTSSRGVPSRMDTTSRPGSDWVGRRLDPRFATWDGFNPPPQRAAASSRRSMSVSSGASSSPSTVQPRASAAPPPPLTNPAARKTLLTNIDRLLPPQHPLRTELRALQSVKRFTQKSIDRLYALEGAVSAPPAPQPTAQPPVVAAQQSAPRPPSILKEPNAPRPASQQQHRVTIQQLPEYEEGRPSSLEGILDEISTIQRKRKEDATATRAESRQRAPTPPVRTRSPILRRSRPASRQSEAAAAALSSGDEEMEEINRQALARAAKTQSQQAPPTALYSFNPRLTSELRATSSAEMNPLLDRETPSPPGSRAPPYKRARSVPPEREREFRPRPISTLPNTDDKELLTTSVLFNFRALGRERQELERKQERVLQLQRQELQRQLLEEKQAEEREREERQRQFEERQEQEREARQRQLEAEEAEDRERLENLTRARRSGAKTKAIAATYSSSSSEGEVGAETPLEERERKRARRSGAKSAAIAADSGEEDEAANQRLQEFQRAAYERKRQTAREQKRLNKIERRRQGELRREEVERTQGEEERDKAYERWKEKRYAKFDRREAACEAREEAYERARLELAEQQERERKQLEEEQEQQRQAELRQQEEGARIEREQKERAAQQAREAETARQAAALLEQQQKEAAEAERRRQVEEKRKSDALAAKAAATKRQAEVDRLEAEQRALQQKAEKEAAAAREESKRLAAELAKAERKAQQLAEEQRAEAERTRREQQERERQQRLEEQRKQKEADEKRQRELDELERLRQEQELARERRLQELTVPPIAPTPPEAPRMETTKPLALPPPGAALQPTRSLEPQHELQTPPTAPLMETTAPLVLPSTPSASQAMESVEPELELPSTKVIQYLERLKRERGDRELQLQQEAKVRQAELASNIADAVLESTLAKPNAGVAELAAAIQTAAEAEEHLELMVVASGEVTPTNGSVIMESGSGTPKSAFSMVSGVSQISSGDRAVQTLRQAAEQLRRSSPTTNSSILLGDDAEAMNIATPSSSILLPTPMEVERQKAIREAEQVLAARAVARPEAAFATPPVAAATPMEVEKRQAVIDAAQQLAQMNRPSSPPPMGNTPPVAVQAPVPRRAVNVNPANPSATARALVSEMRSRARDRQMSAARPTTPTLSPAATAPASETSSPPASIAPTLMYGTHIDVNERPPTPGSEFSQTLEPPTAASVLLEKPPSAPAPTVAVISDQKLSSFKAHIGDSLEDILQYTTALLHQQQANLTKRKPIKRIGASEVRHIRASLLSLTDELSQTRPEELKLEKLQVATAKNTIMRLLGEQPNRARQPPAKALAGVNSDLAELQSISNEDRFSFLGPSTSARAPVQEVREPAPAAVKVVINNQGGGDTASSDSDTSSVSSQSSVRSRIPRPSHEPPKEAFARARNTWANPEARREREAFRRREQRELERTTTRRRQSDKNPIVYSSSESEQPEPVQQQQLEDYEDSDDDL